MTADTAFRASAENAFRGAVASTIGETTPTQPPSSGGASDPLIVIRASSLSAYPDCTRRAAARVFTHEIAAAGHHLRQLEHGVGAATGTACHSAAAYMLTAKMRDGSLGDEEETRQRALQSLGDTIAEGVSWDGCSPDLNTAQKQVLRQVAVYRRDVAPVIVPEVVEQRLEADLEPGVIVSGQVDVGTADGLRDLKTGALRRANGFQYGTYALLHRAHGRRVDSLFEDFLPRVRLSRPQPPAQSYAYDPEEAEKAATAILRRMVADLRAFRKTGDPWSWMANPMSVLCSEKFCEAWGTSFCKAHKEI